MAKKGPRLPDIATILAAGIDPKTGLPYKMGVGSTKDLSPELLNTLRIIDEQDAVNRGRWYNLPGGISRTRANVILQRPISIFLLRSIKKVLLHALCIRG